MVPKFTLVSISSQHDNLFPRNFFKIYLRVGPSANVDKSYRACRGFIIDINSQLTS